MKPFSWMLAAVALHGCAADSPSTVQAPGEAASTRSKALDRGADLLQSKPPISAIDMSLDGFHFYADDAGRQVEAHHYCSMLNEDVHQCVIYDGNGPDAKLIGVEFIVSARLFAGLPEPEKRFWHSHRYEVKSGTLVMPGIPERVEREAMEKLAATYGKTWHFWQVDRKDPLPLGVPQLMMGFTRDGQLRPELVEARDRRMEVSSAKKREAREAMSVPPPQPGADAWEGGESIRLEPRTVRVQNLPAVPDPKGGK